MSPRSSPPATSGRSRRTPIGSWLRSPPWPTAITRTDGIVIHCFAGKDRTGIISALLLGVAGVPDEIVAADYAASGPNMEHLFGNWIATAENESELELRQRLAQAPHTTMIAVLAWLRDSAGGAASYLGEVGLADAQITRLRARLVEA